MTEQQWEKFLANSDRRVYDRLFGEVPFPRPEDICGENCQECKEFEEAEMEQPEMPPPPILEQSMEFSRRSIDLMQSPSRPSEADLKEFLPHAFQIGADLSRGHDIGYSREMIGGNLVMVKRALAYAEASTKRLWDMRSKTRSMDVPKLYLICFRLEAAVRAWLEELSARAKAT